MIDEEEYLSIVGIHKPGSITRIELKNFLTHGHAVINPGPRLNMVVGANGTGKSTILNAICLGLGGEPKLLGRADDLREFIMHDQDKSEIKIELQPHPGKERHCIRRIIDRHKGSERGRGRGASTFYINDNKSTIADVKALVFNEYGILIDNLCTFLPQDKVGNFSGFSDECRLIETEKTLSKDGHYYELHQKLIAEEAEMSKSVVDVDSIQDNLNKLQHEFDRLEREKELAEERERALQQVELLKMKRLWLEFERLRLEALELKQLKDSIKVEIKAARELIAPLESKYERVATLKKEMESKHKVVDQKTQQCIKELEKQEKKFETHDDEMEGIMAKLNEIDSKRGTLEKHLRDHQQRLKDMEEEWNNFDPKDQIEKEHDDAVQRMKDVKKEYDAAKREDRAIKSQFKDHEERAHSLQSKLVKMNDDTARRREKIFRDKRNLGIIYDWLCKNRTKFRRPVAGPVAAEVVTKSQNAAAYLEYHVSNQVLYSFVVETKEDYNLLYDVARNELKVPVNILLVARIKPVNRQYSNEKMEDLKKNHGVSCFLDETITAPDSIMQVLRDYSSIDKVLVGGEKTQKSIDQHNLLDYISEPDRLLGQKELQSSCIFAAKGDQSFRYTQTISRYSKQLGSRIDQVSPAKILAKGIDPQAKQQAENELASVHNEISELRPSMMKSEQKVADLEAESQQASLQAKSAKQKLDLYARYESKIERQRAKVAEIKAELEGDDSQEKKSLVKSLMSRLSHAISAMETHAQQHREMMKLTIANAGMTVNKTTLSALERSTKEELKEKKEAYSDIERKATKIQKDFQEIKQKVASKKREAETLAPIEDRHGNPLPLKEELSALEIENVDEADAAIEELERSIEGIHENPDAIRQYEKLKDEIEDMKAHLEEVRNSKESKLSKIQNIRKPWETALDSYTQKVNALFTKYMAEMGCTGEIRLKKGSSEDGDNSLGNFKDWGIEILVSFRENSKAQVLSAERHSGGERSVSTIMYLMALQDLMVAPFRCVDEINQGLDDRNERLVFKRIVENSTRKPSRAGLTDHSGQYFLITPKLLPNLTDMEEHGVTVLFVYNGIYNFKSPDECDFGALPLKNSKSKRSTEAKEDEENIENSSTRPASKKGRKVSNRRSIKDDNEEKSI